MSRALVRIGLRMMATGRHTIANEAPSSRPPDRVSVLKYSVSVFEMQRPATCQYASGVMSHVAVGPG